MAGNMHELPDSAARHPEVARRTRDADPAEQLEISVYLKPHSPESHASAVLQGGRETREQMRARRVAEHADDIREVTAFATEHGLHVVSTDPERRLVRLSGAAAQFSAAFATDLGMYDAGQGEFRSYGGNLSVPASLVPRIESVLGLDNRAIARPHVVQPAASVAGVGHLPHAVGALYGFPGNATGKGQCVAIIELGGGYLASDNALAFAEMSLPVPTVVPVSVDGGTNNPGVDPDHDGEVALDIQVAGGVAPMARLAVYFAPNTVQGFVDAVSTAAHDTTNNPTVMSISWGASEQTWGVSGMTSLTSALQDAAGLGVSVFAAAGDYLATDGVADGKAHVHFPAASPWAIGCGGTTLAATEVVWNSGTVGTGGGISDYAPVPAFQAGTLLPPSVNDGGVRRGVPDVSAASIPVGGYQVIVGGQSELKGGTSAVAPLWAGLTARLNQLKPPAGTSVGFFIPSLYQDQHQHQFAPAVRDITSGNNAPAGSPNLGYNAGQGWDACTGIGVPNGNLLAMFLIPATTRLYHDYLDNGWHGWAPDFDGAPNVTAVTAVAGSTGHTEVFAIGLDGTLYHDFLDNNGWHGWAPNFDGAPKVAAVTAVAGSTGHTEVFAIGLDGTLYHDFLDNNGWHGWAPNFDGAPNITAVTGVRGSTGHTEVFAIGLDGTLYHDYLDNNGWHGWAPDFDGAPKVAALTAVAGSTGHTEVFAIGLDHAPDGTVDGTLVGTLYHDFLDNNGWHGWAPNFDNAPKMQAVTAIAGSTGHTEVFAIGLNGTQDSTLDGTLYHDYLDNNGWHGWAPNFDNAPKMQAVTAIAGSTGHTEVFAIGLNPASDGTPDGKLVGTLYHDYLDNNGWHGWVPNFDNAPKMQAVTGLTGSTGHTEVFAISAV